MTRLCKHLLAAWAILTTATTDTNAFSYSVVHERPGISSTITLRGPLSIDHCTWGIHQANGTIFYVFDDRAYGQSLPLLPAPPTIRDCADATAEMNNHQPIWGIPLTYFTNSEGTGGKKAYMVLSLWHGNRYYRWTYLQPPGPGVDPTPASCTASKYSDIDFGTIDAKQVNGAEGKGDVILRCDKKASVRLRFLSRTGTDQLQLDNGVVANLKINGQSGATGVTLEVEVNHWVYLSATLADIHGQVRPGKFSSTAVVRVDVQ